MASRGPTPETVCSSLNRSRGSGSENPYRVIESSRTIIVVMSRASFAASHVAEGRRGRVDAIADARRFDDRHGRVRCRGPRREPTRSSCSCLPGCGLLAATLPRYVASVLPPAASAAAMRSIIGARQQWQIARASASAASAGFGACCSPRMRVTIAVTCALSALPLPVTAAFTSLGVWNTTGMPRRAAASATTPPACAVPIAVLTLC